MKRSLIVRWLPTLGVAAVLMAGAASAADVRVMISAGFYGVYSELGPAFERASGHRFGHDARSIDGRFSRGDSHPAHAS